MSYIEPAVFFHLASRREIAGHSFFRLLDTGKRYISTVGYWGNSPVGETSGGAKC